MTSKVVTVNNDNQIVAIALLNRDDVARLGSSLKKVYRIDGTPRFGELIKILDEAANAVPLPINQKAQVVDTGHFFPEEKLDRTADSARGFPQNL